MTYILTVSKSELHFVFCFFYPHLEGIPILKKEPEISLGSQDINKLSGLLILTLFYSMGPAVKDSGKGPYTQGSRHPESCSWSSLLSWILTESINKGSS